MRRVWPLVLVLVACKPEPEPADTVDPLADDLPQPFVEGAPLYPWPSEQYEVPDEGTPSGVRVSVPAALLPDGIEPRAITGDDGFSRVPPILAWLPGGFDASTFPDATDWAATTRSDSPVLLVREDTLELVPALVEIDAYTQVADLAPMIVRPHRALDPSTRYAVIVRGAVKRRDGGDHVPSDALTTLLQGGDSDDRAVQSWRNKFDLVRDAAAAHDVALDDVVLAWTFRTRSEEQVTQDALTLQDAAGVAPTDDFTVDGVWYCAGDTTRDAVESECSPTVREGDDRAVVYGTFRVPGFLGDDLLFHRDAAGLPVADGTLDAPFLVTIPRTVTEPSTGVLFGHGFFSAVDEPQWGTAFQGHAQWRMPAVSTKFQGFAEVDLGSTIAIFANLSDIAKLVDQQLQSQANFTVLHRIVSEHLATELEVDFGDGPFHPLSTAPMPWFGASNGGTQGLVIMATSPVLSRGAVVVPGGGWSHMLQRAVQWNQLAPLVVGKYMDDPRVLQLVMAVLQNGFDRVDSLNYVDHLLHDRFPGRAEAPEVLGVMAVNDSQVANLVTAWVAGNAGMSLVTPAARPIWGLDETPGGADVHQGIEVYDLGVADNPAGNVPPPAENEVHGKVRELQTYRDQVGHFLQTGEVIHTCDGPCTFTPDDW